MRNSLVLLLLVCFLTPILSADEDTKAAEANTKASGRIEAAGTVLDEIQGAPDQRIPEEVLASAECVAVVPSLLNGGFVFGGRYGKGVASCRTPKGWSAPAFFTIGGGSFGLQIGGQATDVIMLIMNKNGMNNLLSSQFKLGADASAAAGPVGLLAGLELSGAVIKQDKGSTREFYGRMVPFKTSLTGEIDAPKSAYPFLSTLAKWAQRASK